MKYRSEFIVIGLCTYHRPVLLKLALQSLASLIKPRHCRIEVVIVDNDSNASARNAAKQAKSFLPFPLEYCVESRKGIPFARNKVVERALNKKKVTAIAFFDDDGQAEPDWLIQLLKYYHQEKVEVVTGPQRCLLPKDAPRWAKKSEFFRAMHFPSGTLRPWAASHNVLFNIDLVKKMNLRFRVSFLTGVGEDQLFFMEAIQAGARIMWVEEAIISETPALERITFKWVLIRNFNYSSQGTRCCRRLFGLRGVMMAVGKGGLYLGYSICILMPYAIVSSLYNPSIAIKAFGYMSRGIGWFAGFAMKK